MWGDGAVLRKLLKLLRGRRWGDEDDDFPTETPWGVRAMKTMKTMRNAADCGKGMFFQSEPLDPPRLSVGKSSPSSPSSSPAPLDLQLGVDSERGVGLRLTARAWHPELDESIS
jgi:hypothetical protein